MRKIIIAALFAISAFSLVAAQKPKEAPKAPQSATVVDTPAPQDNLSKVLAEAPVQPKYLLLVRFLTTEQAQNGQTAVGWKYSSEFFFTTDEVLRRLNAGRGNNGLESTEVVGVYDLVAGRLKFDIKEEQVVEPVKVEEKKWTKRTWYVSSK